MNRIFLLLRVSKALEQASGSFTSRTTGLSKLFLNLFFRCVTVQDEPEQNRPISPVFLIERNSVVIESHDGVSRHVFVYRIYGLKPDSVFLVQCTWENMYISLVSHWG